MTDRAKKAKENHDRGYNCAQAVACAFCDLFDVKEKDIFKMTEAMGFGMGTMGTCGAVSAMAVIAGLKCSDGNLDKPGSKKTSYRTMKGMTEEFLNKNKSIICRELKGIDNGEVLRSCDGCIEDAAGIIERFLKDE